MAAAVAGSGTICETSICETDFITYQTPKGSDLVPAQVKHTHTRIDLSLRQVHQKKVFSASALTALLFREKPLATT